MKTTKMLIAAACMVGLFFSLAHAKPFIVITEFKVSQEYSTSAYFQLVMDNRGDTAEFMNVWLKSDTGQEVKISGFGASNGIGTYYDDTIVHAKVPAGSQVVFTGRIEDKHLFGHITARLSWVNNFYDVSVNYDDTESHGIIQKTIYFDNPTYVDPNPYDPGDDISDASEVDDTPVQPEDVASDEVYWNILAQDPEVPVDYLSYYNNFFHSKLLIKRAGEGTVVLVEFIPEERGNDEQVYQYMITLPHGMKFNRIVLDDRLKNPSDPDSISSLKIVTDYLVDEIIDKILGPFQLSFQLLTHAQYAGDSSFLSETNINSTIYKSTFPHQSFKFLKVFSDGATIVNPYRIAFYSDVPFEEATSIMQEVPSSFFIGGEEKELLVNDLRLKSHTTTQPDSQNEDAQTYNVATVSSDYEISQVVICGGYQDADKQWYKEPTDIRTSFSQGERVYAFMEIENIYADLKFRIDTYRNDSLYWSYTTPDRWDVDEDWGWKVGYFTAYQDKHGEPGSYQFKIFIDQNDDTGFKHVSTKTFTIN